MATLNNNKNETLYISKYLIEVKNVLKGSPINWKELQKK